VRYPLHAIYSSSAGTLNIGSSPVSSEKQGALDGLGLTGNKMLVAAFALRKLFGAYTGPQVRVQRLSDNVQADIFFNRTVVRSSNNSGRSLEDWADGATIRVVT